MLAAWFSGVNHHAPSQGCVRHARVFERDASAGNPADQSPPEIGGRRTKPSAKARIAWLNPLSFDKLFRAVTNIVGRIL